MYYFYYFQDTKTNLYYGGITNNITNRQLQHQSDLNSNKKSAYKNWHLYQDKIQLIILWSFETKSQACIYEKQWIINNYLNPLCLNCSVSNSEYDCATNNHKQLCLKGKTQEEHRLICESGGGFKAKTRYALNINSPEIIQTFISSYEASKFTEVNFGHISSSCKNAKPYNSKTGRWLFSDLSIEDLKTKFKSLTQKEIKGYNNYSNGFVLINKVTKERSQNFYSTYEPQKQGFNINQGHLSSCLLGKRKSVNGFKVELLCE